MIKDVMVRLDGSAADEIRLTAVDQIAELYQGRVIGLFVNVLPVLIPEEGDGVGAIRGAELLQQAHEIGDRLERKLNERLARLQKPVELRRFDVIAGAVADIAAREARSADTFIALRPNGEDREPEDMVEGILFGSGRHLFLVPDRKPTNVSFDRVLLGWNGSRESARAMAEAMPYLHKTKEVLVVVVDDRLPVEADALLGEDAVAHLKHHGINASLHRVVMNGGHVGATLIAEAKQCRADLIVMGGYGHSRLREWLLGGATYEVMHNAPVPLVIAH
jgi:nucleotide-binding universal stress UspA family protein